MTCCFCSVGAFAASYDSCSPCSIACCCSFGGDCSSDSARPCHLVPVWDHPSSTGAIRALLWDHDASDPDDGEVCRRRKPQKAAHYYSINQIRVLIRGAYPRYKCTFSPESSALVCI